MRNNQRIGRLFAAAAAFVISVTGVLPALAAQPEADKTVVLRVCNWEEYIDLGDWD